MEREDELEEYLRAAPVIYERPLPGGGGHAEKKILWLRGGVAVAAKPGIDANYVAQAQCEVAAWLLAAELDMTRLVPVTVMRKIPTTAGETDGSAQVLWAQFKTALDLGLQPSQCADSVGWDIAVFDVLTANTDRHNANWGVIGSLPDAVLVDHGHCFLKPPRTTSPFYLERQGQPIPADLLQRLQTFITNAGNTRLSEALDSAVVQQVIDRAQHLVQGGGLLAAP